MRESGERVLIWITLGEKRNPHPSSDMWVIQMHLRGSEFSNFKAFGYGSW